jgi:citrate lyase subunit beta/citryl-CoA lyase
MLAKAPDLPADEVFLDLEDAVAPGQKEEARGLVVNALRAGGFARVVGVRVNDVSTPWCYRDVIEVVEGAGEQLDFLTIPKVERPSDVTFVADLLSQVRHAAAIEREIGLQVQIESAAGLTHVDEIAAASELTQSLIFGPADLSASLGMPALTAGLPMPGYPGDHFHHALMRILVAARNAGLQAIDGPYLKIRDLDGFREMAVRARALGFDGKWVLHPAQIDVANDVFTPSREEFERAVAVLAAHRREAGEGRGAFMLGDEMIDEASRKMAERVAERGRAAGLVPGLETHAPPPEIGGHAHGR